MLQELATRIVRRWKKKEVPIKDIAELHKSRKLGLIIIDDDFLNAESHPHLMDSGVTPLEAFFVRNNGSLPVFDRSEPENWSLTIDGSVMTPLVLTIHDLKTQFEIVSATAVLECAGNGRALHPLPYDGLPWGLGAVGCARWTGVRLADVLAAAGLRQEAVYVGFQSPDVVPTEPPRPALSRGLPIAKAMAQETLLCFAMNDEPLPFLHGGPLRVVAPGFPGSAWQKWLTRIWVRDVEHDGEKMTGTDYRLPRHPIQPGDNLDQVAFDVLTDMPVRSMITSHAPDFITAAGRDTEWRGFAWGGHTPVAGVELSTDGGLTWHPSELEPASEPFAWRRFRLVTRPLAGPVHLVCRARNMAGQVQPLDHAPWNPRGYCNNVVHRINGTAQ